MLRLTAQAVQFGFEQTKAFFGSFGARLDLLADLCFQVSSGAFGGSYRFGRLSCAGFGVGPRLGFIGSPPVCLSRYLECLTYSRFCLG
jgi:hypothetical protein